MSLREAGNTDASNQVPTMLVSLCTDIDDRAERLMAIGRSAQQGKQQMGNICALPTDFPSLGAPWLLSGLAKGSKLAERLPPLINALISNVPGPQFPLYFAGAHIVADYPVSSPAHGGALNMTVQSYDGALEFGLTSCRRALPDVADLADYVVAEHRALLAQLLAAQGAAAAAQAKPAARIKAKPARKSKATPKAKAKAPAAARKRAA